MTNAHNYLYACGLNLTNMVEFVYRWNGEYFGFIYRDKFFDKRSNYLGWVSEGEVWKKDGTFLGEFFDGHYIVRRMSMAVRAIMAIRATPHPPVTPPLKANRALRVLRAGRMDALDEYN
jgi:hypothetical protein